MCSEKCFFYTSSQLLDLDEQVMHLVNSMKVKTITTMINKFVNAKEEFHNHEKLRKEILCVILDLKNNNPTFVSEIKIGQRSRNPPKNITSIPLST